MDYTPLDMKTLAIFTLCVLAGLCACSDKESPPAPADTGAGDGVAPPASCLTECSRQAPHLCVKGQDGACVECRSDGHCEKNPGALGSTCIAASGVCACSDDVDCAGRTSGQYCHVTTRTCGCQEDADCASPARCLGKLFGVSVCQAPCADSSDCTDTDATVCDTASGRCVACAQDSDCMPPPV